MVDQDTLSQPSAARAKKRWVFILLSVVLLAAAGNGAWLYSQRSSSPIPAKVRKQVKFALYYPVNLPDGLQVDQKSFSSSNQVLTYNIQQAGKNKYFVSIQPLPSNFDFKAFKKKFATNDEFTTTIGIVFAGDLGSVFIASIRTNDNSWILINTSDVSAFAQLEAVARTFQKY